MPSLLSSGQNKTLQNNNTIIVPSISTLLKNHLSGEPVLRVEKEILQKVSIAELFRLDKEATSQNSLNTFNYAIDTIITITLVLANSQIKRLPSKLISIDGIQTKNEILDADELSKEAAYGKIVLTYNVNENDCTVSLEEFANFFKEKLFLNSM